MAMCGSCGQRLRTSARFCSRCGDPVPEQPTPVPAPDPAPANLTGVLGLTHDPTSPQKRLQRGRRQRVGVALVVVATVLVVGLALFIALGL